MAPAGLSVINLTSMGYVLDVYDHEAPADFQLCALRHPLPCFWQGVCGPAGHLQPAGAPAEKIRPSLSGIASGVVAFTIGLGKR